MPRARPISKNNKARFFSALLPIALLWSCALASFASPAAPEIRFENPFARTVATSQQMGGVNSIVQDEFGFIWIAAENGLGRYDGTNLRLYQADPNASRSLPSSFLWSLAVDRDGVFWQGGEGGLSRYNLATDDFTPVTEIGGTALTSESIPALTVAEDNSLYVGGVRKINRISPDRQSMREYTLNPPITYGPNVGQVRSLAIDAQGQVWVATAGMGVAIFDPKTESFDYLLHDPLNSNSLLHNSVRSIMHDDQGRVWLGTYGSGISRLDPKTGKFDQFVNVPDDLSSLRVNIILDILQDSQGTVWVALDQGGLARFDESTQSFHHYLHTPYDPQSLVSSQLRALYEDRNQDLWLGAFPSGISFYNRSAQVFRHYTTRANDPESISHNAILRFEEAGDGTVWVGTEGGLNALDPETGEFRRFLSDPSNPQALKTNPVLSIKEDIDDQLWVGTWAGGLHRLNPETGLFQRFRNDPDDPDSINGDFIWDLLITDDQTLWVATETGGLNRYHRESNSFTNFMHDPEREDSISGNYVISLLEDSRGKLWVGTFTGLDIFDRQTQTFSHVPHNDNGPQATNGRHIRSLFEDSRGKVWVGTQSQGVNIYDPETETFAHLDVTDGLPSSNISSIVEDDSGAIWLATTNGLARVNPETRKINSFRREDGLVGSHFNRNASLKDRTGRLYFGSSEGITAFHPQDLNKPSLEFPVLITKLRILNQDVPIGGEDSPLKQSILITEGLSLDHQATMFSFDFSALNYRRRDSVRYSYQLEGFDQDWNDVGHNATATYTNIGAGDYIFRTRASTNGEYWIEGQSLAITILPPPWRSWWAYCLYALTLGALLLFAHKYITLRVRAEAYRSESITDPLTKLHNRAGIAQLNEGIFANQATKQGMSMMLVDIDHFKRINDRRGHDAGDEILQAVAQVVLATIRSSDHFGRWGGEEFILLAATHDQDSEQLAEKIRAAVENEPYGPESAPVRITISIGVADLHPDDSFETAFKRADRALYRAKDLGRNCVVVSD